MPGNDRISEKDALMRAAELCSRTEQSSGHIREKLKAWGLNDKVSEKIVLQLKKEQFLDDLRFARAYARDKFSFNGWGKIKITHMLRGKGVDAETIREALGEIDETAYEQACFKMISARSAALKEKNPFARKAKLYRFAAGRGFEPDLIYRILDRL